jgi:small ligand-binding sensory domain FIST
MGEAIVGNDREVERGPALSLWLGRWPRPVELEPFHLEARQTPDGLSLLGLPDGLLEADPAEALLMLLGDPFTFPVDVLLEQLNEDRRGLRVVGGMASGGRGPGESRLLRATRSWTAAPSACCCAGRCRCAPSSRKAAARSAATWSSPRHRRT